MSLVLLRDHVVACVSVCVSVSVCERESEREAGKERERQMRAASAQKFMPYIALLIKSHKHMP